MTAQRPGVRHINSGKRLLDRLDFDTTDYSVDIAAAQAYALLGIGEALGEIALTLRRPPLTDPVAPAAETGG